MDKERAKKIALAHGGDRLDDWIGLLFLGAEIEREECIKTLEHIRDTILITEGGRELANEFIDALQKRSNAAVSGRGDGQ